MTHVEPSSMALFWAGVIAVAILVYVILDGFDLGVGVLFGTTRQPRLRSQMVAAISPFWDGNEAWLVVAGAVLFCGFSVVYAVFLSAFYIPFLLLLLALISRGVALEFRKRGGASGLSNWGFFIGSTVAAFVQGAAVGAMIRGIPVANNQYAGGSFEWLRPLPMLCGIGLVLGYGLLGAGRLILKSEGALRDWAWKRIPWLAGAVLAVVCVAFIIALGDRDRISGALHERTWGLVFPFIGFLAIYFIFLSLRLRPQALPFTMTVLLFVAAFLTLAVMFWPYMIPYEITVGDAAAPEASLSFMFWGAGLFILIYTATVYWRFRGKVRSGYVDAYSNNSVGHRSVKLEQKAAAGSGNRVLHRIVTSKKSIRAYHDPAGGWGALKATSEALVEQGVAVRGAGTLLRMNQPSGFDCPGCAWPEPKHTSSFEFCENGAKAVAWEATAKRCTPEFFAVHTVAELETWSDYELEMQGRITHPMVYDAVSDRYLPIGWDNAFALAARHLRALPDPNMAEFYTSGRASNEAAFLYQLFARE